MSITYTVSKAIAFKQIRIFLLMSLLGLITYHVVSIKDIVIKQRELTRTDLVIGTQIQESAKISAAIYLSGRYGNVDSSSIDELMSHALNMMPYGYQASVAEGIKESKAKMKETGVIERFIPLSAKYYAPLNRVWVTGEKFIFVNGENPRFIQWTYEYDFGIKNLRIFPKRIVQYQGTPQDQQQINKYLEERNS